VVRKKHALLGMSLCLVEFASFAADLRLKSHKHAYQVIMQQACQCVQLALKTAAHGQSSITARLCNKVLLDLHPAQ
jgi:hypothetical protein